MVLLWILLLVTTITLSAQEKLKISGKIRVLEPVEVRLENIHGEVLSKAKIGNDGVFSLPAREIEPDVYLICFGETKQSVYLTNTHVSIKGFYNSRNMKETSLSFTGIDTYYEILKWLPTQEFSHEKTIDPQVRGKLSGNMYSALAYIANMNTYEPNKFLLDCLSDDALKTDSGKWLRHRSDSLYHYTIGAEAFDFEFRDPDGKKVRLSDYRGKIVLVDFWASWCGPCRHEMPNVKAAYEKYASKGFEVISISTDRKLKPWRAAIEELGMNWVQLLDVDASDIYGIYAIPRTFLVDPTGIVIDKNLRGEKLEEALSKLFE